jgi:hypothetical protein
MGHEIYVFLVSKSTNVMTKFVDKNNLQGTVFNLLFHERVTPYFKDLDQMNFGIFPFLGFFDHGDFDCNLHIALLIVIVIVFLVTFEILWIYKKR